MNKVKASGQCPLAGVSHQTTKTPSPDIAISNHGSIFLFHPVTQAALNWMRQHCSDRGHLYFAGALVVEPRYVENLVFHAREDGLLV